MDVRIEDPRGAEVVALLGEHLAEMASVSPAESMHALDVEGLCARGITFWTAREGGALLGCGALKDLGAGHGEIKSMRTARGHLRRGVASRVLGVMMAEAAARGYTRLSLETGSQAHFAPARALYARHGFVECGPFGSYRLDANSVFMTREM